MARATLPSLSFHLSANTFEIFTIGSHAAVQMAARNYPVGQRVREGSHALGLEMRIGEWSTMRKARVVYVLMPHYLVGAGGFFGAPR